MSRTISEMRMCRDGISRPILRLRTLEESKEIFWNTVSRGEAANCWLWLGMTKTDKRGITYGIFWHRRIIKAHRFAYFVEHEILPPNQLVCHACDITLCCNPAHLFLGSYLDNNRDAVLKRRHAVGEQMPNSKVTDAVALELRRLYVPFVRSYRSLAEEFGVSPSAVQAVIERRTWKHL